LGFNFEDFLSRIHLAKHASHSNHLSNNFVWEMAVHSSLCLSALWTIETMADAMALALD
jgi:hypothetical protein